MRPLRTALCAFFLCLALILPTAALYDEPQNTVNSQTYTRYASPVTSHLYIRPDGGVTRVEHAAGDLLIQNFTADLEFRSARSIALELPLYGGFFAGEDALYVFSGQSNWEEDDRKEVIRVTKYDHNWNRLGQASLYGANTVEPFEAGSLRCTEYNGYLYVRTCHQMYATGGLNHQANLTFAIQESDMTVTDAFYRVYNNSRGYVSHSFNQFILADSQGCLIAMDQGDAHPRGIPLFVRKGYLIGSPGLVSNYWGKVMLTEFPGRYGDNSTGASLGGLEEISSGYAVVYNYDGLGGADWDSHPRYPYFQYVARDFAFSDPVRLSETPSDTPVLASAGLEGGWVLWNDTGTDVLHYAPYDAQGVLGETSTTTGNLSDCRPIPYEGGVLWYVVDNYELIFYHLTEAGLTTITDFPTVPGTAFPIPGGELYYDPVGTVITGLSEGMTRLEVPAEIAGQPVTVIGSYAFAGQTDLTEVILPDTITSISEGCFDGCTALTQVSLPEGIPSIPPGCFAGCEGLTEITLPHTITAIGRGAFAGCIGLTDLVIPDGVTAIRERTFFFCTALTDVFLPESVSVISDYSFQGCYALKRIVLPASLADIADAFFDCDALEQVLYTGTQEQWEEVYVSYFNADALKATPSFAVREDPAENIRLCHGGSTVMVQLLTDEPVTGWLARYEETACTAVTLLRGARTFSAHGEGDWKLMVLDEGLAPVCEAITGT